MHETTLRSLPAADHERLRLLEIVHRLDLSDGWIGAGFVRDAVWDHLHGRMASPPAGDIDVVWFDRSRATPDEDRRLEQKLIANAPGTRWSVKNQARMHERNGDAPYTSTADALRRWPETATAVAVRLADGTVEILAPYGLDDLFAMVVRPPPACTANRLSAFQKRLVAKRWLERWPRLGVVAPDPT